MPLRDDYATMQKLIKSGARPAGKPVATGTEDSPLDRPVAGSKIHLYPSDIGINPRQASYILFARHSVTGAKVKPTKIKSVDLFKKGENTITVQELRRRKTAATEAAAYASATGGAGDNGASTSITLQRKNIKRTGAYIGLYMPPSVNVNYAMDYSESEIGSMGEALAGLFKDYQNDTLTADSLNQAGATASQGLKSKGLGMIDAIIPGAKDLYALENGTITTPRTEMMFRGTGRRSFSFTFAFIPKDAQESETVHNIVQEFKEGMSPSFKIAGSTREQTIPDVFSIQYMHMYGQNQYINKIGKCYLKTMDVTYGGDKFVTYNANERGAPPQKTNITLAFQELEVMDRSNIKDGF